MEVFSPPERFLVLLKEKENYSDGLINLIDGFLLLHHPILTQILMMESELS